MEYKHTGDKLHLSDEILRQNYEQRKNDDYNKKKLIQ